MLGKKVGIDLGTSSTRILVKGEGIIATEPTVVAIRSGDVQASLFGVAAVSAAHGDSGLHLHRPLAAGAISNTAAMRVLINHVMVRAVGRQRIFKPDVVIAVMSTLPGEQRRALLEAATLAGARTVYLLDAPIAAAMGSGMRLSGSNGHMVIDVGAGKTEVAVLAVETTIASRCLPGHGGDHLAACIADHVKREHGVKLNAPVIDDVIASAARVGTHEERRMEVTYRRGSHERSLTITSNEIRVCLEEHARPIASAVNEVLADSPLPLRIDISADGAILCGGGAHLEGLDRFLSASTGVEVRASGEPQLCAVRGTGYALDNLDVLKRNFMYIR
jgi:rod shape-determining protein MreB and related proteins